MLVMKLATIIQTTRPAFLLLTPICVFLGFSAALFSGASANSFTVTHTFAQTITLTLIVIGATTAHISVNMFNEYYDFKSGLDLITNKTAFSGGSGALPNQPETAPLILVGAVVTLITTIAIGIYFIALTGPKIFPIGLAGIRGFANIPSKLTLGYFIIIHKL